MMAVTVALATADAAAAAQGGVPIFSPSTSETPGTPSTTAKTNGVATRPTSQAAAADVSTADGSTLRARRVVPDLAALKALVAPATTRVARMTSDAATSRSSSAAALQPNTDLLSLDLFPGTAIDVEIERRDTLTPDRIAIVGRVAGDPLSAAYFVVDGDALAADIITSSARYEVRATSDGGHVLREVDPNTPFICDIEPPSSSRLATPPASASASSSSAKPSTSTSSTPSAAATSSPRATAGAPRATAGATESAVSVDPNQPVTVDLMVLYTPAAEAGAGGAAGMRSEIALAVTETNAALERSGVLHRYRLVHTALTSYTESGSLGTDYSRLNTRNDGIMDEVFALSERVQADVVSLVVERATGASGTGAVMYSLDQDTSSVHLWNVIVRAALPRTMPHELGHNAGLKHDRDNAADGSAIYSYAYGYRIPGKFSTIMSYSNCSTAPCPRIPFYSNPDVDYSDTPTGVADYADEARVLRETMPVLAGKQGGCVLNNGTSLRAPARGGAITYAIVATPGCAWSIDTPSPSLNWLTLTSRASGSGSGQLTFTAVANAATTASTDTLTLRAGSVTTAIEVIRDGNAVCLIETSPSHLTMSGAGGSATLAVTASSASCAWSAMSDAPFLTISGSASTGSGSTGNSGTGNGSLQVSVQPNLLDVARTATIAIGGKLVVVDQAAHVAAPATYTNYLAEGATGNFFSTRIALLNPNDEPADTTLRFLRADGVVVTQTMRILAGRQTTVTPGTIRGLESCDFSTVIESSVPLVVDRTMTWDLVGRYGSHAETAVSSPSKTWYLAEGSTSGEFSLFYLLQNPNPTTVQVRIKYLRPFGAPPVERMRTLAPNSRTTIPVNLESPELASTDLSAVITADAPIIVERSMYLSRGGQPFTAGHESAGVTEPATRWFLAEGATGPFFDLFILLANPDARAATVAIDYLLADGRTLTKSYAVPANGRVTVWVDNEDIPGMPGKPLENVAVSSSITSTNGVPILVERTMWWPSPEMGPNYWTEAHNSPGARETGTRWALAEGEVGGAQAAETYILIANTSTYAGPVRVTLLFADGTRAERTYNVLPRSRLTVSASADFAESNGRRFGAIVESLDTGMPAGAAQIVVEHAMYTSPGGVTWAAGTNALAARLK
jgi:hypothetical protein